MKILLGNLKGRNFFMPFDIRPTPNVMRKAIFDILGQDVEELSVLELYAGSGAVGFEALSLGAKRVTFVESDPRNIQILEDNCLMLGLDRESGPRRFEIVHADIFFAVKQWSRTDRKFDLVFADPPYNDDLAKKTLKHLSAHDILQPNCLLIIQHHKRENLPEVSGRFNLIKQRIYGSSNLSIYEGKPSGS